MIGVLVCFLGVVVFVLGCTTSEPSPLLLVLGIIVFFGSIIWGILAARLVSPHKIDGPYVWLKGVNRDYLAQFPDLREY